jgi:hypothetical protein
MGPTLQSLEDLYLFLNANYDDIAAPMDDQQKQNLASLFVTARSNYWTAIQKILHDDDPQVEALVTQMSSAGKPSGGSPESEQHRESN